MSDRPTFPTEAERIRARQAYLWIMQHPNYAASTERNFDAAFPPVGRIRCWLCRQPGAQPFLSLVSPLDLHPGAREITPGYFVPDGAE